jgi:hypothetical protein
MNCARLSVPTGNQRLRPAPDTPHHHCHASGAAARPPSDASGRRAHAAAREPGARTQTAGAHLRKAVGMTPRFQTPTTPTSDAAQTRAAAFHGRGPARLSLRGRMAAGHAPENPGEHPRRGKADPRQGMPFPHGGAAPFPLAARLRRSLGGEDMPHPTAGQGRSPGRRGCAVAWAARICRTLRPGRAVPLAARLRRTLCAGCGLFSFVADLRITLDELVGPMT